MHNATADAKSINYKSGALQYEEQRSTRLLLFPLQVTLRTRNYINKIRHAPIWSLDRKLETRNSTSAGFYFETAVVWMCRVRVFAFEIARANLEFIAVGGRSKRFVKRNLSPLCGAAIKTLLIVE